MSDYRYCPHCGGELHSREIEGRPRLACPSESCEFVFWDNPLPVVAALVEHEGCILLARNRAWPENMFGLITGFVERDESPEEAAMREVKEELDLDSEVVSFIGIYPFYIKNEVIMAFHLSAVGKIKTGEEIVEVKPVSPDKLKPSPFGTGLAIRDWLIMRKQPK